MSSISKDPLANLANNFQNGDQFTYCHIHNHGRSYTDGIKKGSSGTLDIELMRQIATKCLHQMQQVHQRNRIGTVFSFERLASSEPEKIDQYAACTAAVFLYFQQHLRLFAQCRFGDKSDNAVFDIDRGKEKHSTFCGIYRNTLTEISIKDWGYMHPAISRKAFIPAAVKPWGIQALNIARQKGEGDCIVDFGTSRTMGHALILRQFSQVFASSLANRMEEDEPIALKLEGIPPVEPEVIEALMTFIYTQQVKVTQFDLPRVFTLFELSLHLQSVPLQNLTFEHIYNSETRLNDSQMFQLHLIALKHPHFQPLIDLITWRVTTRPQFFQMLLHADAVLGETLFHMLSCSGSDLSGIKKHWFNLPTSEKTVMVTQATLCEVEALPLAETVGTLCKQALDVLVEDDPHLPGLLAAYAALKTQIATLQAQALKIAKIREENATYFTDMKTDQ